MSTQELGWWLVDANQECSAVNASVQMSNATHVAHRVHYCRVDVQLSTPHEGRLNFTLLSTPTVLKDSTPERLTPYPNENKQKLLSLCSLLNAPVTQ